VVTDVLAYNARHAKLMRVGLPAGDGSGCCGNQLMSFTSHGWGYGLLRNDEPQRHVLALFASATHAQTRGTWTAPEEASIDGSGMPYCPPSQLAMPLYLKWSYVYEHPDEASIWLGRAAPRSLTYGQTAVEGVPTSFGRVGYRLRCTGTACTANISLPKRQPPGGLYLRVRPPGLKLANATKGEVVAGRDCVWFSSDWLGRVTTGWDEVVLGFVASEE
jgi:hypothetical protein